MWKKGERLEGIWEGGQGGSEGREKEKRELRIGREGFRKISLLAYFLFGSSKEHFRIFIRLVDVKLC